VGRLPVENMCVVRSRSGVSVGWYCHKRFGNVQYLHVLHSCCFVEAGVDYRSLRGICSYPCAFRLMVSEIVIRFFVGVY
jgi:hypothetical protein